jgi:hypothetical protein
MERLLRRTLQGSELYGASTNPLKASVLLIDFIFY